MFSASCLSLKLLKSLLFRLFLSSHGLLSNFSFRFSSIVIKDLSFVDMNSDAKFQNFYLITDKDHTVKSSIVEFWIGCRLGEASC